WYSRARMTGAVKSVTITLMSCVLSVRGVKLSVWVSTMVFIEPLFDDWSSGAARGKRVAPGTGSPGPGRVATPAGAVPGCRSPGGGGAGRAQTASTARSPVRAGRARRGHGTAGVVGPRRRTGGRHDEGSGHEDDDHRGVGGHRAAGPGRGVPGGAAAYGPGGATAPAFAPRGGAARQGGFAPVGGAVRGGIPPRRTFPPRLYRGGAGCGGGAGGLRSRAAS